MMIIKSVLLFFLASLFEVGGGYLVWLWIREGKGIYLGIIGMVVLALYGVVATFQPQGFTRVYAGYGGFFILFSLAFGYVVEGFRFDKYDVIGSLIALFGVCIILYSPR